MPRVTYEEVKEIIETDISADQITAMITAANAVITNGPAASTAPALTTAELKELERWVAAHLVCMRDPRTIRSKVGDAEAWFAPNVTTAWGKYLNFTWYGQQAIMMDRTGKLAAMGQRRATFRAAPREDSDNFTSNLTKA